MTDTPNYAAVRAELGDPFSVLAALAEAAAQPLPRLTEEEET